MTVMTVIYDLILKDKYSKCVKVINSKMKRLHTIQNPTLEILPNSKPKKIDYPLYIQFLFIRLTIFWTLYCELDVSVTASESQA